MYRTQPGPTNKACFADLFSLPILPLALLAFFLFTGSVPALAEPETPVENVQPTESIQSAETNPPVGTVPPELVGPSPAGSFSFAAVESMAQTLAGLPYRKPDSPSTVFLRSINEANWNGIRYRPERRIWKGHNLPFEVELFHPGFIYNNMVPVELVRHGNTKPIPFNDELFDYPDSSLQEEARKQSLGFAGFRLYYPDTNMFKNDEFAVFLGATHFRALARHAGYGLMARGLIIDPAMADGEKFPYFRHFWLLEPEPGDTSLTIFALMDSPSFTGAYKIEAKPGLSTVMDVSVRLFPRAGTVFPAKVGLAPLTSMYLFSEKENGSNSDYRPEVHNSDALIFSAGSNSWFRRPLNNPQRLEVHSFPLSNPRGFGLIQQDDNFDHYQDIYARFERRPSLWIEPVGDWGPGRLELLEIPSSQDIHDNILAFWVAEEPAAVNGPAGIGPVSRPLLEFNYTMYWMAPNIAPHQMGRAAATRLVRTPNGDTVTFLIDFEGEELQGMSAGTGLTSVVETAAGQVLWKQLTKNPVTGGWRLTFIVQVPQESGVMSSIMSARGEQRDLRLRAYLKKGENISESLTETWVYDLPY